MSKRTWQFRKEDQRKWYWREVDEMGHMLRKSAQYFKERIDCVAHAMRHGYVHPRQRALATRLNPMSSSGSVQQH
jgi:hypothetical protein